MPRSCSGKPQSESVADSGATRISGWAISFEGDRNRNRTPEPVASLTKQEGTAQWKRTAQPNNRFTATNGRPIKFTPERLQQIKNLVERGISREQIAETIGVTVGSLQVTCSRLGISLRRPPCVAAPAPRSEKPKEAKPKPAENCAKLAVRMQYQGCERVIELPLSQDLIGRLAIEAHFSNLSIGEMAVKLITEAVKRDLFEEVEGRP